MSYKKKIKDNILLQEATEVTLFKKCKKKGILMHSFIRKSLTEKKNGIFNRIFFAKVQKVYFKLSVN